MADMHDAFALARAIDGRLALAGEPVAEGAVEAFREALYDYRADGDLDAFLERCGALLAELGPFDGLRTGSSAPSIEGRCYRALDSVFSSG